VVREIDAAVLATSDHVMAEAIPAAAIFKKREN
jgi:hypothetical protein